MEFIRKYESTIYTHKSKREFCRKTNDFIVKYKGRDKSAILGDYDNDGYLDLFVVNDLSNSLYRNVGEGEFIDITNGSGLGSDNGAKIALFADLDLEGDLDIFLCTQGKKYVSSEIIFDGSFSEIADESGLGDKEDNTSNVFLETLMMTETLTFL